MNEEKNTIQAASEAVSDQQIRDEFDEMVRSVLETEKAGLGAAPVRTARTQSKSVVKKPVPETKGPAQAPKKKKKKKKKKSAGQIIGSIVKTVFLVALLLCLAAIGLGAYMFIGFQGDSLETDSVSKLIKTEGISIDDRFDVNASAGTARVKMDKADIWYIVQNQLGDDFIEDIKTKFNDKGLRLSAYGLIIDENGSQLELDVRWNSIKIPCHLPVDISFANGEVTLKPQSLRLLKFDISPKLLKMVTKMDLAETSYSVKPEPFGFVKSYDAMDIEDEYLVFDCTLDPEFISPISPDNGYPVYIYWNCEGYEEITEAAETYASDSKEALAVFLEPTEKKDGEMERMLTEYYTLMLNQETAEELRKSDNFMFDRVLYEYSKEAFVDANSRLVEFCNKRLAMTDSLGTGIYNAWTGSKITLTSKGFSYKGEALDIKHFASEENPWDNYQLFVVEDGFNYVIVNDINAYNEKTPALKKLANKNTVYSVEEFDSSVPYQIGYIARTVNGQFFLSYMGSEIAEAEDGTESLELKPIYVGLSEDEYNSLICVSEEEPMIMVWTGELPPEEPAAE